MDSYETIFRQMGSTARAASLILSGKTEQEKNKALLSMGEALLKNTAEILLENKKDLENADENGVPVTMLDRLRLTTERLQQIANGIKDVVSLPDPTNQLLDTLIRPNGLIIRKVSVPLGVVAVIYEARPNVTVDVSALCLKSGNAVILRGGKEAFFTNKKIVDILQRTLQKVDFPAEAIQLVEVTDREAVPALLKQRQYIDVVIPRGSAGLIQRIVEESHIPVIETGSGVCHTYLDKDADLAKALPLVINAKVQRPSTCNSMETLLVHESLPKDFMSNLFTSLQEAGVELRLEDCLRQEFPQYKTATEEDWATEYNDYILSVKQVNSVDAAIRHIDTYGTKHSECIVTENEKTAELFTQTVDAAAVYVNASTRFTDGFEFGFGAEIGISTQKLHARGPMGLSALTTYKYIIEGAGQIRQ